MADLSFLHILGMLFAVTLIVLASIYAGQKVKSVADFDSGSGSAGPAVVAGAILGTLVGGSSTIGTAQLAFHFGFSAKQKFLKFIVIFQNSESTFYLNGAVHAILDSCFGQDVFIRLLSFFQKAFGNV